MSPTASWSLPSLKPQPVPSPEVTRQQLGRCAWTDMFHRPLATAVIGPWLSGREGPFEVLVCEVTFLDRLMAMALPPSIRTLSYIVMAGFNTRWVLPEAHVVPKTFSTRWQQWRGRKVVPLHHSSAHDWVVFGQEPERVQRSIRPSTLQAIEQLGRGTYFEMKLGHVVLAVPNETSTHEISSFSQIAWNIIEPVVSH